MLSKNIFNFPKGPPVPELWRDKVWWFRENAFGKNIVTFHPLRRFSWNITYFKGNKSGNSKIILVLENTVFPRNDVITKLKNSITCFHRLSTKTIGNTLNSQKTQFFLKIELTRVKIFEWKKLLCKVEFTLLKSKFFPAKFSFSKIQEKNLAGKNTLQKSEFYIFMLFIDCVFIRIMLFQTAVCLETT